MSRHHQLSLTTAESLVDRARRLRRRGDDRKAIVAMREACFRDDRAAWMWTLYGAWLAEMGRNQDAETALSHALWLRRRDHDEARAHSTELMIAKLPHAA